MRFFINLLAIFYLSINYSFSQTYSEEFLDGTIMFQLKESVLNFDKINQPDENIISKNENTIIVQNIKPISGVTSSIILCFYIRPLLIKV